MGGAQVSLESSCSLENVGNPKENQIFLLLLLLLVVQFLIRFDLRT